mgnify:CR=1 FL=1
MIFKLDRDTIVPPFTSKVSRLVVLKMLNRAGFKDLVEEIERPWRTKPYVFSVLFEGGRPLYKTGRDRGGPLSLRASREYSFEATVIGDLNALKVVRALSEVGEVEAFNGRVSLLHIEAETKGFEELGAKVPVGHVKMEFLTPALLQLPLPERLRGKIKARHVLFPLPSLIVYSLARHWNLFAPEGEKIINEGPLSARSNFILMEVDYNIRPTTAVYDERRRPRGITGWVLYKLNPVGRKYVDTLLKLLDYSNYVGVGRSRTAGFGLTRTSFQA